MNARYLYNLFYDGKVTLTLQPMHIFPFLDERLSYHQQKT